MKFEQYRIQNNEGRFSKGGVQVRAQDIWASPKSAGKIWPTKQAFASHLSLLTLEKERFLENPPSLFKFYGDATVIVLTSDGESITSITYPFKEWYAIYFATSEKFRKVRNKKNVKKEVQDKEMKTKSWSDSEKASVTRAMSNLSKFAANVKPFGIIDNEKIGNFFALEIDGVNYAVCKLV